MSTKEMISIAPCKTLPHPHCDANVQWHCWTVTTQSGRNTLTGYTGGTKKKAYAAARKELQRLEMFEGPRRAWEQFSMRPCDMRPSRIQRARERSREMQSLLEARL